MTRVFKASRRRNPQTEKVESYNRFEENYRDAKNYIRHKTIEMAGYIDDYIAAELIFIQKHNTDRIYEKPILMVQDADLPLLKYADELHHKTLRMKS